MKAKRIFSLIMAVLLISLTACSDTAFGGKDTDSDTLTGDGNTNTVTEPVETGYYDNIPEGAYYDNEAFTVLSYGADTWPLYITVDEDEGLGEIMNQATHKRNTEVEDMLGIRIEALLIPGGGTAYEQTYRQQVMAGDADFDICAHFSLATLAPFIADNLMVDWNTIPNVDLTRPWYNQQANEVYTIAGKQYFAVSDFAFGNQQHGRILFNKSLFDKYQLEYPYEAVFDGKWTFDMLMEYCKDFYEDINKDGVAGVEDQYGWVTGVPHLTTYPQMAGEMSLYFDDDEFVLNYYSDRIVSIAEDLFALHANPDVRMQPGGNEYQIFNDGRALFESYTSDPALLRNIDKFDFGYLPYPKYDGAQEDYYAYTYGGVVSVPNVEQDLERTGTVIEALSAASSKYMIDAFIDKYIEGKVLRDDESVEIYRMMRENAVFELAFYVDPLANKMKGYYGTVIGPDSPGIASYYASVKDVYITAYEELYDMVAQK